VTRHRDALRDATRRFWRADYAFSNSGGAPDWPAQLSRS